MMISNSLRNAILFTLAFIACSLSTAYADNKPLPPSAVKDESNTAPISGVIDDNASGWIYSGFVAYDNPSLKNGTGHAGGPGAYAAFTFSGTSLDVVGLSSPAIKVDGHTKRMGRVKISIDSKVLSETNLATREINYDFNITSITGLSKGLHVLQVEPVNGWAVIDYIKVGVPDDPAITNTSKNGAKSLDNQLFITEGDYYLIPGHAPDKFLESVKNETANNTQLEIYQRDIKRSQGWHVSRFENGYYKISPLNNLEAAITFVPRDPKDQTKQRPILWEFAGYPSQIVAIIPKPNHLFAILLASDNTQNPLSLDVYHRNKENEAPVINYDFWNADNQLWKFIPVEAVSQ